MTAFFSLERESTGKPKSCHSPLFHCFFSRGFLLETDLCEIPWVPVGVNSGESGEPGPAAGAGQAQGGCPHKAGAAVGGRGLFLVCAFCFSPKKGIVSGMLELNSRCLMLKEQTLVLSNEQAGSLLDVPFGLSWISQRDAF